jgi:FKBP-type peptidyl-prolyl cis-trans isomerase FkpA
MSVGKKLFPYLIGEKIKVTCPPEKAYGSRGAGSVIPPNTPI